MQICINLINKLLKKYIYKIVQTQKFNQQIYYYSMILSSNTNQFAEKLPDVDPMRSGAAKEDGPISEFQGEIVQLAAVLNGDHFLSSFPEGMKKKKMTVREAHDYVKASVSRFMSASKEALKLGADESAIVDMRSALTTRSNVHN